MAYEYKIYLERIHKGQVDMEKQRILIVHNYYQIPGGEDTVVANEQRMLEKHGHETFLYSRNNSELNTLSKIQKMCLPFSTIFNIKTYREVKRIIKEKRIDIVHVHNTLNLISPSVYYAALRCKVPVVQTVHNFRLLCPSAVFYRDGHVCEDCVKYGLWCAVKHKCYRNSRIQTLACVVNTKIHRITGIYGKINYICLTEFNKKKLLQLKQIKKQNVYVKPNFTREDIFKDMSKEISRGISKEMMVYEKRKNQFVFVGRLDKLKGINLLLKTWGMIEKNEAKLIICGTGPMEEWCRQYIKKNRFQNVVMKGFISNLEVKQLLAESRALIFPTQWYEGFPMNILESFSVGTPVICSDFGNADDIVMEGITGCKFHYNSPDELIQAIKRLNDYKNIYQTTKDKYEKEYTENQNYETLIGIYKVLL